MDWFRKKFEEFGRNAVPAAQAIRRGAVGAVEAANPFDAESRGNKLINQTQRTYGGTNEFKSILDRTNPYVSREQPNLGGALLQGKAAGTYRPEHPSNDGLNSRLWVGQDVRDPEETLRHEGLHAAWGSSQQPARDTFLETTQTALPPSQGRFIYPDAATRVPDARSWLKNRMGNYASAQDRNFSDVRSMNPSMQTEMHSYLPEYYDQTRQPMPATLQAHYSRFYTPGRNEQRKQLASDIFRKGVRAQTYYMGED